MLFRHQTMRLTVLHTASVQSQVLVLSQGGATRQRELVIGSSAGQQRHPVVKSVYYHLFHTFISRYIFHIIPLNIHCHTILYIKK